MTSYPTHLQNMKFSPTGLDNGAAGDTLGVSCVAGSSFKGSLRAKVAAKSEHGAQVMLLNEVRRRGIKGLRFFAIPNAARRSQNLAARMKAEGMRAGAADLVFIAPPSGRAYFLEMKRERGGRRSDAQLLFAREMREAGALHEFADGFAEAVSILERWGLLA